MEGKFHRYFVEIVKKKKKFIISVQYMYCLYMYMEA